MCRRIIACLLLLCAKSFADYTPADGPIPLHIERSLRLHDATRDKDLPAIEVYPTSGGPYPVIIFSHGAGGSGSGYLPLLRYWASHGYVVIAPTHADAVELTRGNGTVLDAERQALIGALFKPDQWAARPADISFLIDSLKSLSNLKGKIDLDRIGVGGHSFGAQTSAVIGGATLTIPGKGIQSFSDPRARAILVLSGEGPGAMGFTRTSFDSMDRPTMVQTGSLDTGMGNPNGPYGPTWKMQPFDLAPAGDKYCVFITGANHLAFTVSLATKPVADAIKMTTLAFWDAYLKGDAAGKTKLQADKTWGAAQIRFK
jgi:predicted dienelactone hydrolase